MSALLDRALAVMGMLHADPEILTFHVYRGKTLIDSFTGTRGEWFDRVMDRLEALEEVKH